MERTLPGVRLVARQGTLYAEIGSSHGRKNYKFFRRALRGDPCSYCYGEGGTVDHIEPKGRGGKDSYKNLTGACSSCNESKGTMSMLHFMLSRPALAGAQGI